jgi:ABC-type branched-subunit amino acid transport system ATPase component
MTSRVLTVHDLHVHFGGVRAVDGVSIALEAGKIYGIMGPNGSGKSTLLAAVSGLTRATSGAVSFLGADVSNARAHQRARKGMARTFQTVRLLAELTVTQNVLLGIDGERARYRHRRSEGEASKLRRVTRAMEMTGVGEFAPHRPGELSYGMQRKVEIARAIVGDPGLLMLDEPAAGMSYDEKQQVCELLTRLRDDGLSQLLVEHDVQMMVDTCDHIFAMNQGKLIAEGRPRDVVRNKAVQEAYLGRRANDRA